MADNKYDPKVYKRLELVRKQFRNQTAEQRAQQAAERRQLFYERLTRNKTRIVRITSYIIVAVVALAVIGVVAFTELGK